MLKGKITPPISDIMDPVQGTNNSLAIALIAAKYLQDAHQLSAAKAELVLDAVKDSGALMVQLLEGLGENIDLYV